MLLGPTGVGKTGLAKVLAESLFDDDTAMIGWQGRPFNGDIAVTLEEEQSGKPVPL